MKASKTTIHDIAKALEIDSSTVSRALNDSPRVTQKTKDKILAKAEELGYQRNVLASNLRKNVTYTIGVIVPRISRHFFSSAIQGIEETAYQAGYNVIICQSLEQLEREKKIVETLLANRVDGVLMSISMETLDYDHLQTLKGSNIPLVFFDRHCDIPGNSNVLIDDFKGGFDATQHLIDKGCKNIVHFSGPQALEIYKKRFEGYKAALENNGIVFRDDLVFTSRLMEHDGFECAKEIISNNMDVDGIFSANDVAAIGAIKCLKQHSVRIPEDIAIVGFSNEPISRVIEPSLTTIDQPGFEIGKLAVNLLLEQIKDRSLITKGKSVVLESNLITRNSSNK
ncbi:LacI family DNA-binding transcriptional regulator [Snuella sedimenti]|uniref:LacI family DNA-binding transcriptional regulator n=1 Tax=Snuella sedimenti TaxID=2798802 RepID=A0A8J7IEX2_9FLAO|nr:LacI family DNA-binding transcriptional regulator [Snuella sedimenti]MBJ6367067.1 LacI family DNA-binding transcriptional regulator [Snuella sedimenti]